MCGLDMIFGLICDPEVVFAFSVGFRCDLWVSSGPLIRSLSLMHDSMIIGLDLIFGFDV
jgi:hypothetical protein